MIDSKEAIHMLEKITVPDLGVSGTVDVIEIHVKPGEHIAENTSLLTLESDKAAMEIPAPMTGILKELKVAVGDKVSMGDVIAMIETAAAELASPKPTQAAEIPRVSAEPTLPEKVVQPTPDKMPEKTEKEPAHATSTGHAGPGVRRFARELGVSLKDVLGSGPKGRIIKQDIEQFVKRTLSQIGSASGPMGGGALSVAPMSSVDFSQFGPIETQALSRIQKLSGSFLHRNWVSIPHITQFDEADITEMEAFRKAQQLLLEKEGVRLTPLVFLMKAVVSALTQFPRFNASLDTSGTQLVLKRYFHIGVAVDTPNGLVVPVIRDVHQKGLVALAKELMAISKKAREGKLLPQDMQGGCFSISSLGGIGGTAFTPIINAPEVAILGISKSQMRPVYKEGNFVPRLMLPLSLSYDHRVIDGAEAARFITYLSAQLADVRRMLL
jgi:pyruvate dehydrogenase E2 component (dihydrolipoamide acetyltransferase)